MNKIYATTLQQLKSFNELFCYCQKSVQFERKTKTNNKNPTTQRNVKKQQLTPSNIFFSCVVSSCWMFNYMRALMGLVVLCTRACSCVFCLLALHFIQLNYYEKQKNNCAICHSKIGFFFLFLFVCGVIFRYLLVMPCYREVDLLFDVPVINNYVLVGFFSLLFKIHTKAIKQN